jgi:hypothetical protein
MVDVKADRVTLLGSGGGGGGGGRSQGFDRGAGAPAPALESSEPLTDDDIPF